MDEVTDRREGIFHQEGEKKKDMFHGQYNGVLLGV
jgi:hypothetical protein